MFRLEIGTGDIKEMSRVIGLAKKVIGSLKHEWVNVVHPYLIEHWEDMFATEGSHANTPWAGYEGEPQYAAYKISAVGHLDLLRWEKGGRFERLYPSLVEKRHGHHRFTARESTMKAGTTVPYAGRLIEGGEGPFGEPSPGRNFMAMTAAQKSELTSKIQRSIVQRLDADVLREAKQIL